MPPPILAKQQACPTRVVETTDRPRRVGNAAGPLRRDVGSPCRAAGASGSAKRAFIASASSTRRSRIALAFGTRLARSAPVMSISSWVYVRTLALGTVLIAHVIPYAADSFARCDPAIEVAQYDREADEYDEAAERYRAWALADDMFATDRYGITRELAQQAARSKSPRGRVAYAPLLCAIGDTPILPHASTNHPRALEVRQAIGRWRRRR
jgi:hypothetical protein